MAKKSYLPVQNITYYFHPTCDKPKEVAKARIKNWNLPFLQWIYNGNELSPLRCLITGDVGFKQIHCFVNQTPKLRFNIDFNHIRQRQSETRAGGISVDKGILSPSEIFRRYPFDKYSHYLTEFMCIMPVSQETHNYISQDSQIGNITLLNFEKNTWPWFLQDISNFNQVCTKFGLNYKYDKFLDHLSDINHKGIHLRRTELE